MVHWFSSKIKTSQDILTDTAGDILMKKKSTVYVDNDNVIAFDVDDTLVLHNKENSKYAGDPLEIEYYGAKQTVYPHTGHIRALKVHAMRGHHVVVWSGSGAEWAIAVAKALKLEKYIDIIMEKPNKYYDDLQSQDWMGKAIYFKS